MVEFFGKIDKEIQAKCITRRGQFLGIFGAVLLILIMIAYLMAWLVDEASSNDELIYTIIIFSVALLLGGIICIPTSRNRLRFEWNYNIKFNDGTITQISNHQNGAIQSFKTSQVKKVIDYGRYYYLFLYKFDPSKGIVCQKSLLINGTIEEFEELFEGKIVRRIK